MMTCREECSSSSKKMSPQPIPTTNDLNGSVQSIQIHPPKIRKILFCKSCGGEDHSRRTSQKCKYYVSRKSITSNTNPSNIPIGTPINMNRIGGLQFCPLATDNTTNYQNKKSVPNDIIDSTINGNKDGVGENGVGDDDDSNHNDRVVVSRPKFISVDDEKANLEKYSPVVDVGRSDFKFTDTVFKINRKDYRNRTSSVPLDLDTLFEKYFP